MDFGIILGVLPLIIIVALISIVAVSVISGKSVPKMIVAVSISIIVVGMVLIPAIQDFGDSPSADDGWEYDDYLKCNATASTGAFEIVTIGTDTYVHAKDIGEGTYTVNGKTISETVEVADLNVVLILGQSNAAYRGTSDPSTASPIPKIGTSYYYGTSEGAIFTSHTDVRNGDYDFTDYGIYDMIDSDGNVRVGNIESPFAATFNGGKLLTINGAVSGSSSANWVEGKYCYTYAQSCIETALSLIDTTKFSVKPLATLWVQGETDAFMVVSQYVENVHELYSDLSSGTFIEDADFGMFLMSLTREGYNSDTAQRQLASEYSGIYLATSIAEGFTIENGKMLSDDLHYSQKGDNELGVAFGKFLNKLI